jgi:hypothetical protein
MWPGCYHVIEQSSKNIRQFSATIVVLETIKLSEYVRHIVT